MAMPSVADVRIPLLRFSTTVQEWGFSDSVPYITKLFQLSDEECEELVPSGGVTVLRNRVAWATSGLKRAGLLESPSRGRYRITDLGRQILENPPAERLTLTVLKRLRPSANDGDDVEDTSDSDDDEVAPEERIRSALSEIERALADGIVERLTTWHDDTGPRGALFEHLVIDLLLAMGYGKSLAGRGRVLGQTGDGGIDGVISEDSLGLDIIYVQAKCWKHTVPISVVREFVGSLASKGISKGILITTSKFTGNPRDALGPIPQRVEFIDGQHLARLMIKHDVGVKSVERFAIKREDNDYFEQLENLIA